MRSRLYYLSLATLAGIAAASAQEVPKRSFEETLRIVLFGDATKSESLHKTADGTTTRLVLTDVDEKACSAGIIIQQDKPNNGETKATVNLDFSAVVNWRTSASSVILEGGVKGPRLLKSSKIEWLRIDTVNTKDEKARFDEFSLNNIFSLPLTAVGNERRSTEAMSYLIDILCRRFILGPSTKF